jgi:hypothetical protein
MRVSIKQFVQAVLVIIELEMKSVGTIKMVFLLHCPGLKVTFLSLSS